MRHIPAIALLLASTATPALASEDEPRLFTAEDVFELEWADDPQISPDGTQAVYVRRSNDIMADRTVSQIWLVDLDGSRHEPLLADGASYRSARWSPDGTRLAYMTSADGRTALNVHYLQSGRKALIGSFAESPGGLTWSPDGTTLFFYRVDPISRRDIYAYSFEDGSVTPLLVTDADERAPAISPDSTS